MHPALAVRTTPNGRPATATATTKTRRRIIEVAPRRAWRAAALAARASLTVGVLVAAAALAVLALVWWSR